MMGWLRREFWGGGGEVESRVLLKWCFSKVTREYETTQYDDALEG
jgi:hypothetical protein